MCLKMNHLKYLQIFYYTYLFSVKQVKCCHLEEKHY